MRGDGADEQEKQFVRAMILEIQQAAGITDEQIQEVAGEEVMERGILSRILRRLRAARKGKP